MKGIGGCPFETGEVTTAQDGNALRLYEPSAALCVIKNIKKGGVGNIF